jgi:hypothetical protein
MEELLIYLLVLASVLEDFLDQIVAAAHYLLLIVLMDSIQVHAHVFAIQQLKHLVHYVIDVIKWNASMEFL